MLEHRAFLIYTCHRLVILPALYLIDRAKAVRYPFFSHLRNIPLFTRRLMSFAGLRSAALQQAYRPGSYRQIRCVAADFGTHEPWSGS